MEKPTNLPTTSKFRYMAIIQRIITIPQKIGFKSFAKEVTLGASAVS
jgi:hypothetical protein